MNTPSAPLIFLKLGGSLITDKHTPSTALPAVISRIALEIAEAKAQQPDLKLVLGHGSGSFGHMAAKKFSTRTGVRTPEEWRGFAEVWLQASALHRIVVECLHEARLPALGFPASAGALVKDGQIIQWELSPLVSALNNGLLPVVYGDVAFDRQRGGTIVSTEDIFLYLACQLRPRCILLAGIEAGVWADYPQCTCLVESITPQTLAHFLPALGSSSATDVTGGMYTKVEQMLKLVSQDPALEVDIFSGTAPGAVLAALRGEFSGTKITS